MKTRQNLTGNTYGELTVQEYAGIPIHLLTVTRLKRYPSGLPALELNMQRFTIVWF